MSKRFISLSIQSRLLLSLLLLLCLWGFVMQYSASGGNMYPYAYSHVIKYLVAFVVLFLIYKIELKIIFVFTDIAYFGSLFLLLVVDIVGVTRLGAQRWLDFGLFVVQPSELMKIALVLMLAKHFHRFATSQVGRVRFYIPPILLSITPFFLIFLQPDLGTGLIIIGIAIVLFFLAGFKIKYFIMIFGLIILLLPLAWMVLHDYQKNRVLTFINPDREPLGAGYHITQSKIAIGSGGFLGKGYLSGTQGQLDFLPEKHTDFVFTLLSEEFGFVGGIFLILIYASIIIICVFMTIKCTYSFGKYVIAGCTTSFFIYIFINIGMVSGLLPVVGVPLPLISFGGTSMMTTMISFGLILNIDNNKDYI